jgi:hypothetical protein
MLDSPYRWGQIPTMQTAKVDAKQRIRIPHAKPGQVYSLEDKGNGTFLFVLCKAQAQEPFPPGSLKKYVTKEDNEERLAILKGCSLEVTDQ